MSTGKATQVYQKIEQDELAQNLIAESHARHILYNVNEPEENFPDFTLGLDDRLSTIAFSYISIGCQYAENKEYQLALDPLEKGANILRNIHAPLANRKDHSLYFVLTSSLAYYACGQYSKSFILLKSVEFESDAASLISLFLKKDFVKLVELVNRVLLTNYIDEATDLDTGLESETDKNIYTSLLAKSFNLLLEYIFSGNIEWLNESIGILDDLEELLKIDNEPSMWWTVRLLRIIFGDFRESSLWRLLPPYFDNNSLRIVDFIVSLAFRKSPVYELFYSQKLSLPIVLDQGNKGAIISLPTSSGKTRIAELGIFHCLNNNPGAKVIYIAPYKSLAYEIEETFELTFSTLGYKVTHLYGGAQYSRIDVALIEESDIIIGTPEKVKAILRASPEIVEGVKMVVIDEGHLLGAEERFIRNELLIEEFKSHMNANGGRILLLSAVLPNSSEISRWLTGDTSNAVTSRWRPSEERFGIIEWTGEEININWRGAHASSNQGFIKQEAFQKRGKTYYYPSDKKDAVSSVAVKLSAFGSVLIFVGLKKSVFTYAKAIFKAMGPDAVPFKWQSDSDWEAFSMACDEAYGEESEILEYAHFGILCHNADLPSEVRMIMERLMRTSCPPIIVATSTLGQGVNIGVSTVIFTTHWVNGSPMEHRDFWNIAGRAGRAYVDYEGKILVCLDRTDEEWRNNRDLKQFEKYFDKYTNEDTKSGIFIILREIKNIADTCGIPFDHLLQLIAENDFSQLKDPRGKDYSGLIEYAFDLMDDSILALNLHFKSYELDDPSDWIDDFFRESLATIQAENSKVISIEELISFLKHRNKGILRMVGSPTRWKGLVNTGLPLKSSLLLDELLPELITTAEDFQLSNESLRDRIIFLESIEKILVNLPVVESKVSKYGEAEIDNVREPWLQGLTIREIKTFKNGQEICNDYYGYTLPWVINAISRKFKLAEYETFARYFEEIALLMEAGLPNILALKIYLAGIKSRKSSIELSEILDSQLVDMSVRDVYIHLVTSAKQISEHCSVTAKKWIDQLTNSSYRKSRRPIDFNSFHFPQTKVNSSHLLPKAINGETYLVSPDYGEIIKVGSTKELPFNDLANDLGFQFQRITKDGSNFWRMKARNPHLS
ncbi:DEAD/DEAH box helicase [Rufibacter ruber]|uniref:DEAD/DEAH box helicase n=1 Tax=Rufibacter ruber TaxID=1783499 RepID=UPI00082EF592|nr:DEAD/DEAH box helicase [Rufibacter ruber]